MSVNRVDLNKRNTFTGYKLTISFVDFDSNSWVFYIFYLYVYNEHVRTVSVEGIYSFGVCAFNLLAVFFVLILI